MHISFPEPANAGIFPISTHPVLSSVSSRPSTSFASDDLHRSSGPAQSNLIGENCAHAFDDVSFGGIDFHDISFNIGDDEMLNTLVNESVSSHNAAPAEARATRMRKLRELRHARASVSSSALDPNSRKVKNRISAAKSRNRHLAAFAELEANNERLAVETRTMQQRFETLQQRFAALESDNAALRAQVAFMSI